MRKRYVENFSFNFAIGWGLMLAAILLVTSKAGASDLAMIAGGWWIGSILGLIYNIRKDRRNEPKR